MTIPDKDPTWSGTRGPKYAIGLHVKGHIGVIHLAPYGNEGADVGVAHKPRKRSDPWVCLCDRVESAFFSAAFHTGPGWRWHLVENRPPDHRSLHGILKIAADSPVAGRPQDEACLNQAIQDFQEKGVGPLAVHAVSVTPQLAAYYAVERGRGWRYHQVSLLVSGPVSNFDFTVSRCNQGASFIPYAIVE